MGWDESSGWIFLNKGERELGILEGVHISILPSSIVLLLHVGMDWNSLQNLQILFCISSICSCFDFHWIKSSGLDQVHCHCCSN